MAERKSSPSRLEEAQKQVEKLEKEESARSALDDPGTPNKPSESRHWLFAGLVISGGLILNVVLIVILGGAGGG